MYIYHLCIQTIKQSYNVKDYNLLWQIYSQFFLHVAVCIKKNISPTSTGNTEAYTSESPAKIDEMIPGTTCTVIHNYMKFIYYNHNLLLSIYYNVLHKYLNEKTSLQNVHISIATKYCRHINKWNNVSEKHLNINDNNRN